MQDPQEVLVVRSPTMRQCAEMFAPGTLPAGNVCRETTLQSTLLAKAKTNEQPEARIRTLDYLQRTHFKFCSFLNRRIAKQFCLITEAGDELQSSRCDNAKIDATPMKSSHRRCIVAEDI
jgi:hypothetical protein